MKSKVLIIMGAMLVTLLVSDGVAFASMPAGSGEPPAQEESSIRITVDGKDAKTAPRQSDVVDTGEKTEDVDCAIPDVTIEMSGDVKSVRLAVDNETCNTYVKEIVENPPFSEGNSSYFDVTSGYKWRVEAITRVVGLESIDTLSRTRAKVDFKMASFTGGGSVYEGSDTYKNCWANHTFLPFHYYEESCTRTDVDLNGPSSIFTDVEGEYSHLLVPSWGHITSAKAQARGYRNMPHVFHATCRGESLPPSSAELECELDSEYIGYE